MKCELRAPTAAAVEWVADHLRQADRAELEATHGMPMNDRIVRRKLLRAAVAASTGGECLAAHCPLTGEAVALLGVAPGGWMGGPASPWLLGTDEVRRYGRDLVAMGRDAVRAWSQHWSLENWAHDDNAVAVAWLRRIGFVLDDPAPRGPAGAMFRRFSLPGQGSGDDAQDDDHQGHGVGHGS